MMIVSVLEKFIDGFAKDFRDDPKCDSAFGYPVRPFGNLVRAFGYSVQPSGNFVQPSGNRGMAFDYLV